MRLGDISTNQNINVRVSNESEDILVPNLGKNSNTHFYYHGMLLLDFKELDINISVEQYTKYFTTFMYHRWE